VERDEDRTGAGSGSADGAEERGMDAAPGRDGVGQPMRDWADDVQPGPTRRARVTLLVVVSLAVLVGLVLCCFAIADVFDALGPFF